MPSQINSRRDIKNKSKVQYYDLKKHWITHILKSDQSLPKIYVITKIKWNFISYLTLPLTLHSFNQFYHFQASNDGESKSHSPQMRAVTQP